MRENNMIQGKMTKKNIDNFRYGEKLSNFGNSITQLHAVGILQFQIEKPLPTINGTNQCLKVMILKWVLKSKRLKLNIFS